MNEEPEEWQLVQGFVDVEVSTLGRLRRHSDGKPKRACAGSNGRSVVYLKNADTGRRQAVETKRLVGEAFIAALDCESYLKNVDGDEFNCSVSNLVRVPRSEVYEPPRFQRECKGCGTTFVPKRHATMYCKWECHPPKKVGKHKAPPGNYPVTCPRVGCSNPTNGGHHCVDCRKYFQIGSYLKFGKSNYRVSHRSNGYLRVTFPGHPSGGADGGIAEHRLVMSDILQRPLMDNENVHHINGMRDDNRPENLELWVKPQVPGQRVDDLIEYVVSTYPSEVQFHLATIKTLEETGQYTERKYSPVRAASSVTPQKGGLRIVGSSTPQSMSKKMTARGKTSKNMDIHQSPLSKSSVRPTKSLIIFRVTK